MLVFDSLQPLPLPSLPLAITIGSYDGAHLGHQHIFSKMREKIGEKGLIGVITFSNHPSHVLEKAIPVPLLASSNLKLRLLEALGVDFVYCISFTPEIRALSYEEFLRKIQQICPFQYLVLGQGATFGKDRKGTEQNIQKLSSSLSFTPYYLPKFCLKSIPISSSLIRKLLQEGNLRLATQYLGHPFFLEVAKDHLAIPSYLCLPPSGNYNVSIQPFEKNALMFEKPKDPLIKMFIRSRTLFMDKSFLSEKNLLSFFTT